MSNLAHLTLGLIPLIIDSKKITKFLKPLDNHILLCYNIFVTKKGVRKDGKWSLYWFL